jgi:hypothetical protein
MIPFRRQEWARRIGVATSKNSYYYGMKQGLQKLFIESYFENSLAIGVGLMAFRLYELAEFLQTKDDKLCTCVTLIFALLSIYLPIRAFFIIKNRLRSLQNPREIMKTGVYYEEVRTNNIWQASFYVIFMTERFLIILILLILRHLPFF